jgi:hypothetical protein
MGKEVIAVHKGDAPPSTLPKAVSENRIRIVPWKHDRLAAEVEAQAQKNDKT